MTYDCVWPSCRYASRATPTSPCPARALTDCLVTASPPSGAWWPSYFPPSSIAFCAACASVMLRPPLDTRSFATWYDSGLPPSVRAAISCSFFFASIAAACAARVIACAVCDPPETHVQGRYFDVFPHVTSHFSHGTSRTSADTRCTSVIDSVPRFPIPDWMYRRPSGLITKSPSYPLDPAKKGLVATPMPRALEPIRLPLRAFRSSHRNCSAPLSSASLTNALVTYVRLPFGSGRPTRALPSGALMR